jgi:hypothetical protein
MKLMRGSNRPVLTWLLVRWWNAGLCGAKPMAETASQKRWDTVGKSFELNAAATKGGENAHWNSRTSYSYPRVYPEKIGTWPVMHNLRGRQISGLSSFNLP